VDHVGVTVPDLDEAVALFTSLLGADLLYVAGPWTDDRHEWMPAALDVRQATTLRLAMLRLGPWTNLELLEFTGGPVAAPAPLSAPGTAHLALHVDDLDAVAARLRADERVRVLAGPTTVPDGEPSAGLRYLYAVTPWGGFLEFVTWAPGMPYEAGAGGRMLPPAPSWAWRPEAGRAHGAPGTDGG
jgi:catechol 2,3-dioxygenase-like lactoylglutathione lyase family enzyme